MLPPNALNIFRDQAPSQMRENFSLPLIVFVLQYEYIHVHISKFGCVRWALVWYISPGVPPAEQLQHGFRSKRSTETQLILTIDDLVKNLDVNRQMDMCILDFSKAFDKVPHQRLLHVMAKLEYYGIRGQTRNWIEKWLTFRVQQVVVDGETSREEIVRSGIPQGTVLGPLMFLIFINDSEYNISSTIRLLADDALIYRYVNNKEDSDILQKDLDQLCEWENKWQMSFNPSKCSVMRITRKKQLVISNYIMHGQILSCAEHHPYLGVEITKDLFWNHHINNIAQSAHRSTNFLCRNISKCSADTKQAGITGMVRPKLEYASSAMDLHQQNQIQRLERI